MLERLLIAFALLGGLGGGARGAPQQDATPARQAKFTQLLQVLGKPNRETGYDAAIRANRALKDLNRSKTSEDPVDAMFLWLAGALERAVANDFEGVVEGLAGFREALGFAVTQTEAQRSRTNVYRAAFASLLRDEKEVDEILKTVPVETLSPADRKLRDLILPPATAQALTKRQDYFKPTPFGAPIRDDTPLTEEAALKVLTTNVTLIHHCIGPLEERRPDNKLFVTLRVTIDPGPRPAGVDVVESNMTKDSQTCIARKFQRIDFKRRPAKPPMVVERRFDFVPS